MSSERGSNHFVKGAAILGIAGLLSKLLGALYRIPYQNITGDIGLYVYMQVYPLYTTLLILATAGFPIAISKIVSERLALGDTDGARRAFRIASVSLVILGLFFFLLLYLGAPLIARMMGDEHLTLPLKAVAWSLPFVPIAAILRGYFQGQQNMMPTGVSQVVEQLFRVIFILAAAYWMMAAYNDAYLAGTGAVFAALPGALGAIFVLLFYWRRNNLGQTSRESAAAHVSSVQTWSNRAIVRSLLFYALPICLGALVLPLIPLVDSMTVVNLLQWSGTSEDLAKLLKGAYDRGQPLIQFGTFFATSLSLALVPAISEAVTKKQMQVIVKRTEVAIRLTMLLGLPASFGLALLTEPINIMLYGDTNGNEALAIQSFTILFATLSIATSGILQGLGEVTLPARHLFIGVVVKLVLNLALIPLWGISGAAMATVLAYAVAMALNMMAIRRHIEMKWNVQHFLVKPTIAVLVMSVLVIVVEWVTTHFFGAFIASERMLYTLVGLFAVATGGIVYVVALMMTGGITGDDLKLMPKGQKLHALFAKLRLVR